MTSDLLVKIPSPHPLGGLSRDGFEAKLRSLLKTKVVAAYLFGSINTERFTRESDVDLILVVKTQEEFHRRCLAFPELFDLIPRLDLRIYTPQEWNMIQEQAAVGFWKSVRETLSQVL